MEELTSVLARFYVCMCAMTTAADPAATACDGPHSDIFQWKIRNLNNEREHRIDNDNDNANDADSTQIAVHERT